MAKTFETYRPDLTKELVMAHLQTWIERGFRVIKGTSQLPTGWVIILGRADQKIGVKPTDKNFTFSVHAGNLLRGIGQVSTLIELIDYLNIAAQSVGVEINKPPTQQACSIQFPLSLWSQLNAMVEKATIEIIWDSYLDNKSLENIKDLASLGCILSPTLKLLTSDFKKPTKNFLEKFNSELGINAVLKIASKDHPRLIFLSDGRCISLDFSLNKEQNGTINTVETAPKKVLFESAWQDAKQAFL